MTRQDTSRRAKTASVTATTMAIVGALVMLAQQLLSHDLASPINAHYVHWHDDIPRMSTIIALAVCCVSTFVATITDMPRPDDEHKGKVSPTATAIVTVASILVTAAAYAYLSTKR